MNLEEALQTFIAESRELLEEMEAALLTLNEPGDHAEAVNAIFRAAHTIKGSAGLFGLDHVVAFTHVAESVLDEVRAARVAIDGELLALLLRCADHIGALVTAIASGMHEPDLELEAAGLPLLAQLRGHLASGGDLASAPALDRTKAAGGLAAEGTWHLSLRFGAGVLRNGMDPMSFLRYLRRLGEITAIVTLAEALPDAAAMDPESCYLGFELALRSAADKATIENVFEFVLDDSSIRILPPHSRIGEFVALIEALPECTAQLGEILVRCGSVTAHELERALNAQQTIEPTQRLGDILVQQGRVPQAIVDAALDKQQQARASRGTGSPERHAERASIRVDADKLDRLIDLVGELIIASAGAGVAARRVRDAELMEAHSTLCGLVEEVRDSALQLRMVKIGATFSRFQRVVHDVARELGKDIGLVISGEDT